MTDIEFNNFCGKLFNLTEREQICLDLVARGFLSKEIGYGLKISEITVNSHMKSARKKMNFDTTKSLVDSYKKARLK